MEFRVGVGEWKVRWPGGSCRVLCGLIDLIHQSYTVDLLQKGLTLLIDTFNNDSQSRV